MPGNGPIMARVLNTDKKLVYELDFQKLCQDIERFKRSNQCSIEYHVEKNVVAWIGMTHAKTQKGQAFIDLMTQLVLNIPGLSKHNHVAAEIVRARDQVMQQFGITSLANMALLTEDQHRMASIVLLKKIDRIINDTAHFILPSGYQNQRAMDPLSATKKQAAAVIDRWTRVSADKTYSNMVYHSIATKPAARFMLNAGSVACREHTTETRRFLTAASQFIGLGAQPAADYQQNHAINAKAPSVWEQAWSVAKSTANTVNRIARGCLFSRVQPEETTEQECQISANL